MLKIKIKYVRIALIKVMSIQLCFSIMNNKRFIISNLTFANIIDNYFNYFSTQPNYVIFVKELINFFIVDCSQTYVIKVKIVIIEKCIFF